MKDSWDRFVSSDDCRLCKQGNIKISTPSLINSIFGYDMYENIHIDTRVSRTVGLNS